MNTNSTLLFTIGFTQSTAENFFGRLKKAGVKTVVDVRLHTDSQLAGFAKKRDLAFFLNSIAGIAYRHEPLLAPSADLFELARSKKDPARWEQGFMALLAERKVEKALKPADFGSVCLMCAEPKAHDCHRSFVAAYLQKKWKSPFTVTHL